MLMAKTDITIKIFVHVFTHVYKYMNDSDPPDK